MLICSYMFCWFIWLHIGGKIMSKYIDNIKNNNIYILLEL